MIKVSDYARNHNVSVQAVYKLIRNHGNDLKGHVKKKGRNGTFLDDDAVKLLESFMIDRGAVVVSNEDFERKLAEQNIKIIDLMTRIVELQDELLAERSLNAKIPELESSLEDREAQNKDLQAQIEKQQAEIDDLRSASLIRRIFKWGQ